MQAETLDENIGTSWLMVKVESLRRGSCSACEECANKLCPSYTRGGTALEYL